MAKSMLDMSLDDIVEAQRREGRAEQRDTPQRRGGYTRDGGGGFRGGRGGGSWGAPQGGGWGGPSPGRGRGGYGGPYGGGLPRPTAGGAVVRISGLDYSVLEADLRELFTSIGGVNKVWIDYDRTDRSVGTGGCVFKSVSDAERAVEAFDGRRIEGKRVHLELQAPRVASAGGYRSNFFRRGGDSGGDRRGRMGGVGGTPDGFGPERRFREPRYVEPW